MLPEEAVLKNGMIILKNAKIYGCDIIDNIKVPNLKRKRRIKLNLNENAYEQSFIDRKFKDKLFDFILDDGPHTRKSMIEFIKLYSPLLTDNGILIIEDVKKIEWLENLTDVTPEHLKIYRILRFT